jgi:trans-2,3-dihydro-3-hydroxyanthranilate isomerase
MQIAFQLVDVFADQPLTGNPLAVVPQADGLEDDTLKSIARELRQAETTFLLTPTRPSADWRLRSFTASGVEVFGAGHNSLGAWWSLAESGRLPMAEGQTVFSQEIGDRLLPVEIDYRSQRLESVTLTQSAPAYGKICEDLAALASALGLTPNDFAGTRLPAQTVSTGAPHLLVQVHDRTAVERASPNAARLTPILEAAAAEGCYLFSLDPISPSAMAHARFFNPAVGLFEDSATGTAAGPLACQLVARGIARQDSTITIEQGYEMARPSLLRVHVRGDSVRLSGRCVRAADGMLRIR